MLENFCDDLSMPVSLALIAAFASFQILLFNEFKALGLGGLVLIPTLGLIGFFLYMSFTDPGEIKAFNRTQRKRLTHTELQGLLEKPAEQASILLFGGQMEAVGYKCRTCGHVRPPGMHHSRVTDRCCVLYDHYCYFVKNDVGFLNMPAFRALLRCIFAYCVGAAVLIVYDLSLLVKHTETESRARVLQELLFCILYFVISLLGSLRASKGLEEVSPDRKKKELLRTALTQLCLTPQSIGRLMSMSQEELLAQLNPNSHGIKQLAQGLKKENPEVSAWEITLLYACCDQ